VTGLHALEFAAWAAGALLLGWIVRDAWCTSRDYDERLLTSSREGEIEKDLIEAAANLERIEDAVERLPGAKTS